MMTAAAPACSAALAFWTNSHSPRSMRAILPTRLAPFRSELHASTGSAPVRTYSALGKPPNDGLKDDSRTGKLVDSTPLMDAVPVNVTKSVLYVARFPAVSVAPTARQFLAVAGELTVDVPLPPDVARFPSLPAGKTGKNVGLFQQYWSIWYDS